MQKQTQNLSISESHKSHKINMPHYTKFEQEKFGYNPVQEKNIPNSTNKYKSIALTYNNGTKEAPQIDDLLIEGPELRCIGGIRETEQQGGKKEYSVQTHLDQSDTKQKEFTAVVTSVFALCCRIIDATKSQHQMFDFDVAAPSRGKMFTNPVYYPIDKQTGQIIQGKPPVFFIKLFKRMVSGFPIQSLFTDVAGKKIEWPLLYAVEMKFIPQLHIESIYIGGGKIRLQIKLKSAVVTDVKPLNTESTQTDTIASLSVNKDIAATLAAQIAKLKVERKDMLDKAEQPVVKSTQQDVKQGSSAQGVVSAFQPPPMMNQGVMNGSVSIPINPPMASSGGGPTMGGPTMGGPTMGGMINPAMMSPGQAMMFSPAMAGASGIGQFMAGMPSQAMGQGNKQVIS